jgi:hypothetical protein
MWPGQAMTEDNAVVVHVQMTLEDSAAFQRNNSHPAALLRPDRRLAILAWIFLGLSVVFIPGWIVERTNLETPIAFGVSAVIGFLPLVLLLNHAARRSGNKMYGSKGLFLRPHDISVSSQGVWFKSDVYDLRYDWRAFVRVEETPTHFFIYIDKLMAHIVPKREFRSTEDADRFGTMLRANIKPDEPSA